LRLLSFGGYGLALAALALVVFGAYDSYPHVDGPQIFFLDLEILLGCFKQQQLVHFTALTILFSAYSLNSFFAG